MRKFIDEKGNFEIKVPITWKYSIKNAKVHTFQDYETWKSDTFQLSLIRIESKEIEDNFRKYIIANAKIERNKINCYRLPDEIGKEFTVKSWAKRFNETIVFFTLTYSNKTECTVDDLPLDEKVKVVQSVIETFKLIEETKREYTLKYYRFELFIDGIGATMHILNRAVGNKAFIEATCILANQIDALLRTGIILQQQILDRNSEIESEWFYQGTEDKKKSEKDIYNKSKEIGIIDNDIHKKLYSLYEDRNRVVHRFIISEITFAEVEEIAYSYYKQQEKISQIIYDLESEQINLGIGMTRMGALNVNEDNAILNHIKGKMGKLSYFDNKDNPK